MYHLVGLNLKEPIARLDVADGEVGHSLQDGVMLSPWVPEHHDLGILAFHLEYLSIGAIFTEALHNDVPIHYRQNRPN